MASSKIPFKTNLKPSVGKATGLRTTRAGRSRKVKRATGLSSSGRKRLKVTKVNVKLERARKIKWVVKWVLIIPLSIYAFAWLVVLLIDLFAT